MAIKENELTQVSDIALNDKMRLVTAGGASNNGLISTLADVVLRKYKSYILGTTQSIASAVSQLSTNPFMGQGYGECATAAATAAKTAILGGGSYRATAGGIVTIRFRYAVPANATLNIESTGAYPIYFKNTNIVENIIHAGDICTFMFDESHYVLISIDSPYSIESATPSINNITAGSIVSSSMRRSGKFREIRLAVKNSEAISAGNNIFAGTLTKDLPVELVNASGYYASTAGVLQISAVGAVTVRAIGGSLPANSTIYVGCMYMCNE